MRVSVYVMIIGQTLSNDHDIYTSGVGMERQRSMPEVSGQLRVQYGSDNATDSLPQLAVAPQTSGKGQALDPSISVKLIRNNCKKQNNECN